MEVEMEMTYGPVAGKAQHCQPLNKEELALLPRALFDQVVAAPAKRDDCWLVLSAEPADAPSPQTWRLQAAIVRIGHHPLVIRSSRLEVQGFLKMYGSEVGDDMDGESYRQIGAPVPQNYRTENSVSRLARDLVEYAVSVQASDIHLECRRDSGTRVRVRRNGRLVDGPFPLKNQQAEALANYLFSLGRSGNRQWQPNTPCDGVVDLQLQAGMPDIQLRLSSLPEVRGWDLAARLFTLTKARMNLAEAGYSDQQIAVIREACHRPYGAILFSGPTGSGKSTSMLAALAELPGWLKIVSLEQPVERTLANASHITAGLANDLPTAAPAFNRCDADVAVLGELRDAAGAAVLSDFATAGKLTLATVHAARASSIPLRLQELGIHHSLLCDPTFLVALINQRLIPQLCPHCRLPIARNADRLPNWYLQHRSRQWLAQADGIYVRGDGCNQCSEGCQGRLLIAEVLLLDESDYAFWAVADFEGWRRSLPDKGLPDLQQMGMGAVQNGLADPMDASRVLGLPSAEANSHYLQPRRLD